MRASRFGSGSSASLSGFTAATLRPDRLDHYDTAIAADRVEVIVRSCS